MATPWYDYPITQAHTQNGETGVDLGTPFGTPITDLYAGTVEYAGNTHWSSGGSSGGLVAIRTDAVPGHPNGLTEVHLHVDHLAAGIQAGSVVHPGEVVAYSGGQTSGGHWPVQNTAATTFSTGPHSELDLFNEPPANNPSTIWNDIYTNGRVNWNAALDPTGALNAAKATGGQPPQGQAALATLPLSWHIGPITVPSPGDVAGSVAGQVTSGVQSAVNSLFSKDHLIRLGLGVAGIGLLFIGLNRLSGGVIANGMRKTASDGAMAGAMVAAPEAAPSMAGKQLFRQEAPATNAGAKSPKPKPAPRAPRGDAQDRQFTQWYLAKRREYEASTGKQAARPEGEAA